MKQSQMEGFRKWFDDYVRDFYGSDAYINFNLKYKEDHCQRVCNEMCWLAEALGLDERGHWLAQFIGLFHDIGRFEQFQRYQTYKDSSSVNHCALSIDVLTDQGILQQLQETDRSIVETAIRLHGAYRLPKPLQGDRLFFVQMIRDADKLDIYRIVMENYDHYQREPEQYDLGIQLSHERTCTPEVIQATLTNQLIKFHKLKTVCDLILMQLGWVYDMNFAPTLRRIQERGYLEKILSFLPVSSDIEQVRLHILNFVESSVTLDESRKNV